MAWACQPPLQKKKSAPDCNEVASTLSQGKPGITPTVATPFSGRAGCGDERRRCGPAAATVLAWSARDLWRCALRTQCHSISFLKHLRNTGRHAPKPNTAGSIRQPDAGGGISRPDALATPRVQTVRSVSGSRQTVAPNRLRCVSHAAKPGRDGFWANPALALPPVPLYSRRKCFVRGGIP